MICQGKDLTPVRSIALITGYYSRINNYSYPRINNTLNY